jgi:hypothetical protein
MDLQARGNVIFIITNYINVETVPVRVTAVQEIATNISNTVVA